MLLLGKYFPVEVGRNYLKNKNVLRLCFIEIQNHGFLCLIIDSEFSSFTSLSRADHLTLEADNPRYLKKTLSKLHQVKQNEAVSKVVNRHCKGGTTDAICFIVN